MKTKYPSKIFLNVAKDELIKTIKNKTNKFMKNKTNKFMKYIDIKTSWML